MGEVVDASHGPRRPWNVNIVTVVGSLPPGFGELRKRAEAEGFRHMTVLASSWEHGQPQHRDGEVVMAAVAEGQLVAIGGLTLEPSNALPGAYRMRRFYVRPDSRARGVGRLLAAALLKHGRAHTNVFTVHAERRTSRAFWEALGFVVDERNGWSHVRVEPRAEQRQAP